MEYINPIFSNSKIVKEVKPTEIKRNQKPKQPRAVRSDRQHNIKFPITSIVQMKLRSHCKQGNRHLKFQGKAEITQTKFNTLLLRYGLQHPHLLQWTHEYTDTKTYMHTNLLENEYIHSIGGPHGIAIQKNLSDRKVVFQIIFSVLKWMEGEGSLEKIL
ncbi:MULTISPECIES: hypothetical protein [Bacillus]|uniref:hypothetical protein n=1 Tax=Bacillus TaxID=1386 RepID=UPI00273F911A|nr:hypothetical protein [Bacillus sp. MMSF_3328]